MKRAAILIAVLVACSNDSQPMKPPNQNAWSCDDLFPASSYSIEINGPDTLVVWTVRLFEPCAPNAQVTWFSSHGDTMLSQRIHLLGRAGDPAHTFATTRYPISGLRSATIITAMVPHWIEDPAPDPPRECVEKYFGKVTACEIRDTLVVNDLLP